MMLTLKMKNSPNLQSLALEAKTQMMAVRKKRRRKRTKRKRIRRRKKTRTVIDRRMI